MNDDMKTDQAPCLHQDLQYEYGRTVLLDTNICVLNIKATCTVCHKPMRFLGLPTSNVLKERPFTHDDGRTITIPMVADGEPIVRTPSMSTKQ